jgi:uncharacterized protein
MHIIMKLSKLCNLRCTYCYEYAELGNKERMPLAGLEYFFRHLADYLTQRPNKTPIHLVLHGGEALLLPESYLREFCELQRRYLGEAGIEYTTSVQSNLVKVADRTLDLLEELNISLGVSLDVFGDQRVDIKGHQSQDTVLKNLQRLIDRDIPFAAIAVLHAQNIDYVIPTYQFFNELGIDYRILPIFSHEDPPERIRPLLISPSATVKALQTVAQTQFAEPTNISVMPLWVYFTAAIRHLQGHKIDPYEPANEEWALIMNTNGDIYSHGDAYQPEGLMGNVFSQPLAEIFTTKSYQDTLKLRHQRLETCHRCVFDRHCNQLPIAEAIPSERTYDDMGTLQCQVARPMIQFMVEQIQQSVDAQLLLQHYGSASVPAIIGR